MVCLLLLLLPRYCVCGYRGLACHHTSCLVVVAHWQLRDFVSSQQVAPSGIEEDLTVAPSGIEALVAASFGAETPSVIGVLEVTLEVTPSVVVEALVGSVEV